MGLHNQAYSIWCCCGNSVFTWFVNPVAILIGLLSIQAGVYFVPFVKDKSKNEKNSNSENNTDEKKL